MVKLTARLRPLIGQTVVAHHKVNGQESHTRGVLASVAKNSIWLMKTDQGEDVFVRAENLYAVEAQMGEF